MRPIFPFLKPLYAALVEPAYALMRIAAGGFLIPHGMWKLFSITGSRADMIAFFSSLGLEPAALLNDAVGVVEFFGGILIVLGLLTRPAALAATLTTGTAALFVHLGALYVEDAGIEFAGLWTVVLLYIAIRGSGRISVDRLIGREV